MQGRIVYAYIEGPARLEPLAYTFHTATQTDRHWSKLLLLIAKSTCGITSSLTIHCVKLVKPQLF